MRVGGGTAAAPKSRSMSTPIPARAIPVLAFLLGALGPLHGGEVLAAAEAPGSLLGPASMEAYRQVVVLQFASEEAAGRESVRIAPLYHDLRAALATRMDESNLNDLQVVKVLERFRQKGSFYLNDTDRWCPDRPATGIVGPREPARDLRYELPRNP